MTKQTRQEAARMACRAFQPRLVGDPCVYPNCACKGPSEVADYVVAGREALQGIVKAWDSLRMGDYPRDIIETWLADKMKPAIDKGRAALAHGEKKRQARRGRMFGAGGSIQDAIDPSRWLSRAERRLLRAQRELDDAKREVEAARRAYDILYRQPFSGVFT